MTSLKFKSRTDSNTFLWVKHESHVTWCVLITWQIRPVVEQIMFTQMRSLHLENLQFPYWNQPKVIPKSSQSHHSHPKVIPKSFQSHPKVIPKSSQSHPKNHPKVPCNANTIRYLKFIQFIQIQRKVIPKSEVILKLSKSHPKVIESQPKASKIDSNAFQKSFQIYPKYIPKFVLNSTQSYSQDVPKLFQSH